MLVYRHLLIDIPIKSWTGGLQPVPKLRNRVVKVFAFPQFVLKLPFTGNHFSNYQFFVILWMVCEMQTGNFKSFLTLRGHCSIISQLNLSLN